MLILADTDGLGVDLYQFGEGVHETSPYGHGPPDRHVLAGEFLPGSLGCRVDGRPALVDADYPYPLRQVKRPQEGFRFPARRAVSHGDGLDLEPPAEVDHRAPGLVRLPLRCVRIDSVPMKELALPVETDHLASRPEPGIDGENALLPQRGSKQELAEVVREHPDRLRVGAFLHGHADLRLHGREKKPRRAVLRGRCDLFGRRRRRVDKAVREEPQGLLFAARDGEHKETLPLSPPHREHPVRRRAPDGLLPLMVVPVSRSLLFLSRYHLRCEIGLCQEEVPHRGPCRRVLAYPLGDDIPGARERLFDGPNALFGIDESGRLPGRIETGGTCTVAREEHPREGLQSFLSRDGGPGPPFGAKGQIEVLEHCESLRRLDLFLQILREQFPLLEGPQDRPPALVQFLQLFQPVPYRAYGHLVKGPRGLFPVPGNEGNRGTIYKKRGRRPHPSLGDTEFTCYLLTMLHLLLHVSLMVVCGS